MDMSERTPRYRNIEHDENRGYAYVTPMYVEEGNSIKYNEGNDWGKQVAELSIMSR